MACDFHPKTKRTITDKAELKPGRTAALTPSGSPPVPCPAVLGLTSRAPGSSLGEKVEGVGEGGS